MSATRAPIPPPRSLAALLREQRRPAAIALLALVLRLGLLLGAGTWHVPPGDDHFAFSYENGRIAREIAAGNGFLSPHGTGRPSAWMPPFYPFLLAAVFSVTGTYSDTSALLVLLFQCLAGAAAVLALHALARALLGPRAADVAALALALHPAAVYLSAGMVWPSEVAVVLVLLVLLAGAVYRDRGGSESALLGGLLTGLLGLADPVCLVVLPCLWLAIAAGRGPARTRIGHGALATAGALVLLLPWTLRNRAAFGEWVLVKSNFGHELWLGNNPFATGFWLDANGDYMASHLVPEERARLEALSEAASDREYRQRAVAWMGANPGRVAALSLRRAGWFWWRADFPAVREKEARAGGATARLALTLALRLSVVLGAAGAAVALARRAPVGPVLLFLLLYPLAYYITHMSNYRYRHPVEPLLLLLAGALVGTVRGRPATAGHGAAPAGGARA